MSLRLLACLKVPSTTPTGTIFMISLLILYAFLMRPRLAYIFGYKFAELLIKFGKGCGEKRLQVFRPLSVMR